MFDSFIVSLVCPTCESLALREIQTKAFATMMAIYRVGDIVMEAPIGEFWLKEDWWCEKCRKEKEEYEHSVYIRLVDGLFVGIYNEEKYKESRKRALDTYEIMRLFQKSAQKGTMRKFLVHRIYYLIKNTQKHWRDKEKTNFLSAALYADTPEKLLKEINNMIKYEEGNELENPKET